MAGDFLGVRVPNKDHFVNGGTIAAAVLAILLVALSTFCRRRRHPAVRFLVWGASVVFLPLTSSIISLLRKRAEESSCDGSKPPPPRTSDNDDIRGMWTVLLWIVLILTIKCNADTAAAAVTAAASSPSSGDAGVDGQRIRHPVEHLAQYAWLAYLIWVCIPLAKWLPSFHIAIFIVFSALGLAKLALKLAAFRATPTEQLFVYAVGVALRRASDSFALGKNARLVAGYMAQLVDSGHHEPVPRYIVMGERKKHVEEKPQGYQIKSDVLDDKYSDLVTLDRVWQEAEHGGGILAVRRELRDLCLSFSLFKSLRRRLSGYPLADAGSENALNFVLRGMDGAGAGVSADRMFRVLEDELWFASDFYYSPIPLCTFGGWCAIVNYLCSVLIIVGAIAVGVIYEVNNVVDKKGQDVTPYKVITYSLLLAAVLVEAWEIVAGVCSNWTKMALLGHYIRHESAWRRYSCVHAALGAVLRLRPAKRWRDQIGQNSVLEPGRFRRRTGLLSEKFYGRAGLFRSVVLSQAVKDAVLRSLLSIYGRPTEGAGAQRVGGKVDWARFGITKSWAWDDGDGSSNTEQILVWHVAMRLFEMKSTSASPEMTAASHLSNYFAYLVAAAPELLPDCAPWTQRRYEEVTADVKKAIGADSGGASESTEARYERLVTALSATGRDSVLRRGAELGRHLVKQYADDEASACRVLADFWSEMVLYVAPSENVKGHVQAMARGGEFVTLVWALLLHAGVTTRPDAPASAIP